MLVTANKLTHVLVLFDSLTMASPSVLDWTVDDVAIWLQGNGHEEYVRLLCTEHRIDGKALLILTETDLKSAPLNIMVCTFLG
jgi:SAM domain (Sterile alpha motif).